MYMLTIQPRNSYFNRYNAPEFKGEEDYSCDFEDEQFKEQEREYLSTKRRIENVRENILETVEGAPKPVKNTFETLAVGASALIGGMTIGWGGRKSIQAIKELLNSKAGVKFTTRTKEFGSSVSQGIKDLGSSVKETARNLKSEFKQTNVYNNSKSKLDNFFTNTKFGRKLVGAKNAVKENSVYKKVTGAFSDAYRWCSEKTTALYRKLAGIKAEQVENATVNTLGVSGGVASGVTALQEQQKESNAYKQDVESLEE